MYQQEGKHTCWHMWWCGGGPYFSFDMGLIFQLVQQLFHNQTLGYPSSPQCECSGFSHVSPPHVRQNVGGSKSAIWLLVLMPGRDILVRRATFDLRVSSRISIKIMYCKIKPNAGPSLQIYHPLKYWKENLSTATYSTTPIKARFPIWDLTLQPYAEVGELHTRC